MRTNEYYSHRLNSYRQALEVTGILFFLSKGSTAQVSGSVEESILCAVVVSSELDCYNFGSTVSQCKQTSAYRTWCPHFQAVQTRIRSTPGPKNHRTTDRGFSAQ